MCLPSPAKVSRKEVLNLSVLSARWRAGTTAEPHEIELLTAVDNKQEPEDLPLAPWS